MKKVIIYFFAFVFICFLLPAMLTKTNEKDVEEVGIVENDDVEKEEDIRKSRG